MKDQYTIEKLKQNSSFCTKAFSSLTITPSGAVTPCCLFESNIKSEDNKPYKIWQDTIKTAYNSSYMKLIRKKMVEGVRIDACKQCYQIEACGGKSQRMFSNEESYEMLASYNPDADYLPVTLDLKVNNVCNLKCRMCQPRDSNQVHAEFKKIIIRDADFSFFQNTNVIDTDLNISFDEIPDWDNNEIFLQSFANVLPTLRKISIVGGEPLLTSTFYSMLDLCITAGVAKNIFVAVTTNLTRVSSDKILRYQNEFHSFLFNISLDAIDDALYYIRYPSQFEQVSNNFKLIYMPDHHDLVIYQFSPTIQVYNILYVDKVFYYVEELLNAGFKLSITPVHLTFLEFPIHLNIRILPKEVRAEAIKRFEAVKLSCKKLMSFENVVAGINHTIFILKNDFNPNSDQYMKNFMYYTNTIDQERGQSMERSLPELFKLVSNASEKPILPYYKRRWRAWQMFCQGKPIEAIYFFISKYPTKKDKSSAHREIAWTRFRLQDYVGAKKSYELAYKFSKNDKYILKGLALTYLALDEKENYKRILPAALKFNPGDSELH